MKRHNESKAYLFLAPAIVVAAVFWWFPAARGLVESFLRVNQAGKVLGFAGLSNYRMLFQDQAFRNSLSISLRFILIFVPTNTFITLLAASLTRRPSRFSAIPEYIFLSPVAISLSAYSLLMKEIFRGSASVANRLLGTSGGWITEPAGAMATLVILGVFLDFGIDYIILMCAFRSIDRNVVEAARMDGADGWRLFFQIELPLIGQTAMTTIFLALKDAILICAPIIILTEGGPFRSTETLMFYYYIEAFKSGNRAVQNALSSLILAVAVAAMAVFAGTRRKGGDRW